MKKGGDLYFKNNLFLFLVRVSATTTPAVQLGDQMVGEGSSNSWNVTAVYFFNLIEIIY